MKNWLGKYRLFQQAFAERELLVCYTVKANSSQAILELRAEAKRAALIPHQCTEQGYQVFYSST